MTATVNEFIDYELTRNPAKAARLGLPTRGPLVPDMSEATIGAQARQDSTWLRRLTQWQSIQSGTDDAIDRELAISGLQARAIHHDWLLWRRSPELYTTPILTAVQLLLDQPHVERANAADQAAQVLAHAPQLIAQGRSNLDPELAVPRLLRRAAIQARSAATWCRSAASFADRDDTAGRDALQTAGATAAASFEAFGVHLDGLAETAHGTVAVGEDRYNSLLQTSAGSSHDAASIHALGHREIRRLRERIAALRAEQPRLIASQPAASAAELIGWYRSELRRARDFCIEHAMLTLPTGEECTVAATPAHRLASLPVASYDPPPLLADTDVIKGRLLVPVPQDANPDDLAQALSRQRRAGIATITIHEGYPGHHAHYARMAAIVGHRPIRGLFANSFHFEGWGVYVEQYANSHGHFDQPDQALAHLTSLLVRAVRATIEPALHSGDMTIDQAKAFLESNLRLPSDLADAEIDRYLAYPTQAASYLAGADEIATIIGQANISDQLAHNAITGCGSLPLTLLRRVVQSLQPAAPPRP